MKLTENEIKYKLNTLLSNIEEYKRHIAEIESSKISRIKFSKDLNEYKKKLAECLKNKTELEGLLAPYEKEKYNKIFEQKNIACQQLINDILKMETIHDENNREINIDESLRIAFIAEIENFMKIDSLSYTYNIDEGENYKISEALTLNNNKIDITITTEDYPIAAKKHTHYKTPDEMLIRYMKYLNEKSTHNKSH